MAKKILVALIAALVILGMNFASLPDTANAEMSQSRAYWSGYATPFAILGNNFNTTGEIGIEFRNADSQKLIMERVSIFGSGLNFTHDFSEVEGQFSPGETKIIWMNTGQECEQGRLNRHRVNITYRTVGENTVSKTQFGAKDIITLCGGSSLPIKNDATYVFLLVFPVAIALILLLVYLVRLAKFDDMAKELAIWSVIVSAVLVVCFFVFAIIEYLLPYQILGPVMLGISLICIVALYAFKKKHSEGFEFPVVGKLPGFAKKIVIAAGLCILPIAFISLFYAPSALKSISDGYHYGDFEGMMFSAEIYIVTMIFIAFATLLLADKIRAKK